VYDTVSMATSQKVGCYIIDQGCLNYGTCAQIGTRKDFLGTRHSLLSQIFVLLLPDHRLFTLNNMYIQGVSGGRVNILGGGSMDYSE